MHFLKIILKLDFSHKLEDNRILLNFVKNKKAAMFLNVITN